MQSDVHVISTVNTSSLNHTASDFSMTAEENATITAFEDATAQDQGQDPTVSKFFGTLSTTLNPFYWIQSLIFGVFGNRSPPDYLSDMLPLALFYSENETRSTILVFVGALALCLLVVFAAETKAKQTTKSLVPWKTLSFCRLGPEDVQHNRVHHLIEETFAQSRLAAACFAFDLVHEVTPVEAILITALIHSLARRKGVQVFAFIENHAFSVGYLLSLVGSRIYATEMSRVGKLQFCRTQQAVSRSSRSGGYFQEVDMGGKRFDEAADELFHVKVAEARGREVADKLKAEAGGSSNTTWIGLEAREAGLVDDIKSFHNFAREKFPHARIKFIRGIHAPDFVR